MSLASAPRTVVVRDALVQVARSRSVRGDVVATGGVLTHVGPDGPCPPDALVLDGSGATAVPILVEGAIRARGSDTGVWLTPGSPAAFAVVRGSVAASRVGEMLMINPRDMLVVVLEEYVVVSDGTATDLLDPGPDWVGAWTDPSRGMTQHLTAAGRYSETRGGRRDAYTGRFWAHRDWIAYLDDTGFWAFGHRVDDVLHHARFVLRRVPPRT